MKKLDIKSVLVGFIIATVGVSTVFASSGIRSAEFSSVKVYFYGVQVPISGQMVLITKNGESNAQMYMPVREVLEYMNFIVEWDAANNAINLTMKSSPTSSEFPSQNKN